MSRNACVALALIAAPKNSCTRANVICRATCTLEQLTGSGVTTQLVQEPRGGNAAEVAAITDGLEVTYAVAGRPGEDIISSAAARSAQELTSYHLRASKLTVDQISDLMGILERFKFAPCHPQLDRRSCRIRALHGYARLRGATRRLVADH